MNEKTSGHVAIQRWRELRDGDRLLPEIDTIFFEASATRSFAGNDERAAFRERWLGPKSMN